MKTASIIALAAGLLVAGCVAATSASAISAYPFKTTGDSGLVSGADIINANSGSNPEGWDACVVSDAYETGRLSFQQYSVPDCVPIQSPYIPLKALGTRGWAIYCPAAAPNSWISTEGGGLQGWSNTASSWALDEISADNTFGPSPPAKSDYFMTNWSFKTVYFEFLVGCSPQPVPPAGLAGNVPPYCCGQGTSARPTYSPPPSGASTSTRGPAASAAADPVTASAVRGPKYRRTVLSGGRYTETKEVALGPNVTARRALRCDRGFVPNHRHWGVGWYTDGRPTRKDGAVREFEKPLKRGFAVRVEANERVKKGTARLQVAISCRTRGQTAPAIVQALDPLPRPGRTG